ncbi:GTP-binding protein [Maritalea sp.]|uniref:GTP-binding protein n=1 Tax=Maritalea sp. TaxID=2003361 RepID=UPI003EF58A1F
MRTLNLGILAHVDAGKTSLTERLLFAANVIHNIGTVDGGNTQTDTLELERQRGITIKAAVVSFEINDLTVNLIDTPGHPDFIAEVERVLNVLDGAVLVISAVEGIQPQTRILMRALKRLGIPTMIFINKVDRMGADCRTLYNDIANNLAPLPIALGAPANTGTKAASYAPFDFNDNQFREQLIENLSEPDEQLLADYITDPKSITPTRLKHALARQTALGNVTPIVFGSAMSGAGIDAIQDAIATLLPAKTGNAEAPLAGTIFKIDRGWGGERVAYASITSGKINNRDIIPLPHGEARIKGIQLFEAGKTHPVQFVEAGRIAMLSGLSEAKIGDTIGVAASQNNNHHFAPPTLETRVTPNNHSDTSNLWLALNQMADQDPLINLRKSDEDQQIFVSLYGEVQKEIIQQMLLADFNIPVAFEKSTIICVERVTKTSTAIELIGEDQNPYYAAVGLRVEPRAEGTGNAISLEADIGQMPAGFYRTIESAIDEHLNQGVFGWQIADCHVAITHTKWQSPATTATDFRELTPLVLAKALQHAEPVVCEPINLFHLELPMSAVGSIMPAIAKVGAQIQTSRPKGNSTIMEGLIAAGQTQNIQQLLPNLTGGEGVLECSFSHFTPMSGNPPHRTRTGPNPFDREEYMHRVRHKLGVT